MAAKKRKRGKRTNPGKKKRAHARKRTSNPKRTHHKRKRHANPKRAHHKRAKRRNPSHFMPKRKSHRRRARRNPGGPYMDLALGALVGAAAYVGTMVAGYFVTDDMVKDGQRNRGIIGAVGAAVGAFLAPKHPFLGGGLAVGSLLGAFGGLLQLEAFKLLPPKSQATQAAVYANQMSGYEQIGAVYANQMSGYEQIGAVYANQMSGYEQIGDLAPPAPWTVETPYG